MEFLLASPHRLPGILWGGGILIEILGDAAKDDVPGVCVSGGQFRRCSHAAMMQI